MADPKLICTAAGTLRVKQLQKNDLPQLCQLIQNERGTINCYDVNFYYPMFPEAFFGLYSTDNRLIGKFVLCTTALQAYTLRSLRVWFTLIPG